MQNDVDSNSPENEDIRIRASAIIATGKARDREAIPRLIEILENENEVEWLRGCAAIALGRIAGDEVADPLIKALQDKDLFVSRAVILALGELKNEEALPHLKALLANQAKKDLHPLAINVLAATGGKKVTSTLLEALENENSQVRCNAALALGDLRSKEAVVPFLKLMEDENETLRAIAASALGLIGDKRAADTLIKALEDKADTVRIIAASSLGYLGETKAIAPLERALKDKNKTVRAQAAAALSKLRN